MKAKGKRIKSLHELTPDQRRLVLALIEAAKNAKASHGR